MIQHGFTDIPSKLHDLQIQIQGAPTKFLACHPQKCQGRDRQKVKHCLDLKSITTTCIGPWISRFPSPFVIKGH